MYERILYAIIQNAPPANVYVYEIPYKVSAIKPKKISSYAGVKYIPYDSTKISVIHHGKKKKLSVTNTETINRVFINNYKSPINTNFDRKIAFGTRAYTRLKEFCEVSSIAYTVATTPRS